MRGNGVRKLKKIHAMLYAIEKDPTILKTVLMKYIFFVDLVHYNQRGSMLFDSSYQRLPKGPVDGGALALADESNQYFDVIERKMRYGSRSKLYNACRFRARVSCDLSLFSPYEQKLMAMVLAALKGHKACEASSLTHELRLWKEFSDGDTIPVEYFNLNDDEITLLEKNGLHMDGFERTFCREMMSISQEIADAIHPLNAARIQSIELVIDSLIRAYPLPSLRVCYDAYLAWDDTFRSVIRADPIQAPIMTAKCCDLLCYVSYALYAREEENPELQVFCDKIEEEFNAIGDDLIRIHQCEAEMVAGDLLDRTMSLSRSLALGMLPDGRR